MTRGSPTDVSISVDLFPDLRPDTIRLLLQRTVYSTNEEREAELLATLLHSYYFYPRRRRQD